MKMFGDHDEDWLLARSQRGDGRAWGELVERFEKLVYSIPRRMRLNSDDCADVFQSTFLALHKNLDKIQSGRALVSWLSITATREAMRLSRQNSRTVNQPEGFEEIVADDYESADEQASRISQAYSVQEAIRTLGDKCRDLLTILYLEDDSSYATVTERMGMKTGAIGPTRARCLERLRAILGDRGLL